MVDALLGLLVIVSGTVLIFLALGEILLRICVALFGVWLIGYGFKLRGKGSLYRRAYNWYTFRRF